MQKEVGEREVERRDQERLRAKKEKETCRRGSRRDKKGGVAREQGSKGAREKQRKHEETQERRGKRRTETETEKRKGKGKESKRYGTWSDIHVTRLRDERERKRGKY